MLWQQSRKKISRHIVGRLELEGEKKGKRSLEKEIRCKGKRKRGSHQGLLEPRREGQQTKKTGKGKNETTSNSFSVKGDGGEV